MKKIIYLGMVVAFFVIVQGVQAEVSVQTDASGVNVSTDSASVNVSNDSTSVSTDSSSVSISTNEVETIGDAKKAGILPDSPFYFLKEWARSVQLAFAFKSDKKAKLELKFAGEDVLAAQEMAKEGKEISEDQIIEYEKHYNKSLEYTKKAKDEGKNVDELSQKLLEDNLKHIEVLLKNLEKISNTKAKEAITLAIQNSTKNLDSGIKDSLDPKELAEYQKEVSEKIADAIKKVDETASESEKNVNEALKEAEKKTAEALKESEKKIEEANAEATKSSDDSEDVDDNSNSSSESASEAAKKAEEDAKEAAEKAAEDAKKALED